MASLKNKVLLSSNYNIRNLSLGIVTFWSVLLYFVLGFYYEDHSALGINIQSGLLTNGIPLGDFYIYAQTFTGPVYAFLHSLVPSFPWVNAIFYLGIFTSSVLIIGMLIHAVKKQFAHFALWAATLTGSAAFLILLAEVFVLYSGTRVAFIITASATLGFFWLLKNPLPANKKRLYLGVLIILFSVGFLIRHEAGIGALVLVLPFAYLYTNSIKKILYVYVPIGAFFGIIVLYLWHKSFEIPFLKAIEPEIYLLSDSEYKPHFFAGKSTGDSLRYVAITKNVMLDEGILTAGLVQQMVKEKSAFEKKQPLAEKLMIAVGIAQPNFFLYSEILLINILLLVLAAMGRSISGNKFFLFYILYQLYFWAIIFTLAFLVKMEPRIFASLISILTTCNLLLVLNLPLKKLPALTPFKLKFAITLVLFTCTAFSLRLFARGQAIAATEKQLENILAEMQELAKNNMIMVDVDSRVFITASPFTVIKFPPNRLLLYDQGQLALLPEYKRYIDGVCQCNSLYMNKFYDFLYNNRHKVVFAAREDRLQFFKAYLKALHHKNYNFVRLKNNTGKWLLDDYYYTMHYYTIVADTAIVDTAAKTFN